MNVSKEADAEFMRLLEHEDPERHARLQKNMRRDNPNAGMTEEQALTNFMLGLPIGRFRLAVVAGKEAPVSPERARGDQLLRNGTTEEWVGAIVALANAPEPIYAPAAVTKTSTLVQPAARKARGGRPKLSREQKVNSRNVRRGKVRANVARHRARCNQKTLFQPTDYTADTSTVFGVHVG